MEKTQLNSINKKREKTKWTPRRYKKTNTPGELITAKSNIAISSSAMVNKFI